MNIFRSIFGGQSDDGQTNRPSVMTAAQAKALLEGDDRPFILDVREPSEYTGGHINGAKLIPLGSLQQQMDQLPKDKPILCVCASGSRSSSAANLLARAGYTTINLRGGMMGWQMAGFPVKRGK
ncbi:MAG: rhodanese-like domain-containing protein [Chloroflexi bacterium]|uniref:rhodanese-like domain-containing protein n=1 Tax=Candidatus Flexifilum breve TaxID=3140694 RepID=UPI003135FED9|nr:rhodanese-like domain-containing protein [Chloroflexota bacterium]